MKKTVIFITLLLFAQCNSSGRNHAIDIEKFQWKYGDGLHVGDWLDFKSKACKINNDTIYQSGSAVALVTAVRKGRPGDDTEMDIVSLD